MMLLKVYGIILGIRIGETTSIKYTIQSLRRDYPGWVRIAREASEIAVLFFCYKVLA